jgi:hypothetical protein
MSEQTTNQANNILSYNENWNSRVQTSNQHSVDTYNNTMRNAGMTATFEKGKGEVERYKGVGEAALHTIKQGSEAHNFDSSVAGFGKGKGFTGYFHPYTQGQMVKGRMKYAGARVQQAVGADVKTPISAKDLGMKQKVAAPSFKPSAAPDLAEGPGTKSIPGSAVEVGAKDTDTALSATMAKAGGGMYAKGAGEMADIGAKGGVIRKGLSKVMDLAPKQTGAIADVAGKGLGFLSAGDAIYDRFNGDYAKDTKLQKAGNTGDMIAGGLDALSIAMPVLAPVAGVASAISAGLDIAGAAQSKGDKATAAKAKEEASEQGSKATASVSSEGKVGAQQISAY